MCIPTMAKGHDPRTQWWIQMVLPSSSGRNIGLVQLPGTLVRLVPGILFQFAYNVSLIYWQNTLLTGIKVCLPLSSRRADPMRVPQESEIVYRAQVHFPAPHSPHEHLRVPWEPLDKSRHWKHTPSNTGFVLPSPSIKPKVGFHPGTHRSSSVVCGASLNSAPYWYLESLKDVMQNQKIMRARDCTVDKEFALHVTDPSSTVDTVPGFLWHHQSDP